MTSEIPFSQNALVIQPINKSYYHGWDALVFIWGFVLCTVTSIASDKQNFKFRFCLFMSLTFLYLSFLISKIIIIINCFYSIIIKIKCNNVAKSLVQGKFSVNVSYGDSDNVHYNEKFIRRYFDPFINTTYSLRWSKKVIVTK